MSEVTWDIPEGWPYAWFALDENHTPIAGPFRERADVEAWWSTR